MESHEDELDERPLYGRRRRQAIRFVVILGIAALLLPGILTSVSFASASAHAACVRTITLTVSAAVTASARFELLGPGGIGWECYAVDRQGNQTHIASLGFIPGMPDISRGVRT